MNLDYFLKGINSPSYEEDNTKSQIFGCQQSGIIWDVNLIK